MDAKVDVLAVIAALSRMAEARGEAATMRLANEARAAVAELIAAAQQQQAALLTGFGGISTAEHDADCRLRRALIACGVKS